MCIRDSGPTATCFPVLKKCRCSCLEVTVAFLKLSRLPCRDPARPAPTIAPYQLPEVSTLRPLFPARLPDRGGQPNYPSRVHLGAILSALSSSLPSFQSSDRVRDTNSRPSRCRSAASERGMRSAKGVSCQHHTRTSTRASASARANASMSLSREGARSALITAASSVFARHQSSWGSAPSRAAAYIRATSDGAFFATACANGDGTTRRASR